jgi:hypothetical protein
VPVYYRVSYPADAACHKATPGVFADRIAEKQGECMGINEIDYTIYPYTVGREDCKVLPRSFKTLADAEAYLAEQDEGAQERGEFYLDGPENWVNPSQELAGVA